MDPRLPALAATPPPARPWPRRPSLGREAESTVPFGGGELVRVAAPVARARRGRSHGAVVVSTLLPEAVAAEAREVQERYAKFRKAQTFREPIKAVYLSLYLFPALLDPVRRGVALALPGPADHHARCGWWRRAPSASPPASAGCASTFPSGNDEFTALIASFNRMSERLARSEEEVEHSRSEPHRARTRSWRSGAGSWRPCSRPSAPACVVVDHEGTADRDQRRRLPPPRHRRRPRWAARWREVLAGPGREEILELVERLLLGPRDPPGARGAGARRAGATGTWPRPWCPCPAPPGSPPGAVLVLDDLTPADARPEGRGLGRGGAQARPRDQEPAHADPALGPARSARPTSSRPPTSRRSSPSARAAIVEEVEALKNLVDEFAQFARLPAANLVPALAPRRHRRRRSPSTTGSSRSVRIERRLAAGPARAAPRRRPDEARRHQPRRQRHRGHGQARARSTIATEFDRAAGPGPPGRGRRRPGHPARGPRPALRAALLDQEAGQRPRPRHREPHRPGAPRRHPRGGQRAPGRALRGGAAG